MSVHDGGTTGMARRADPADRAPGGRADPALTAARRVDPAVDVEPDTDRRVGSTATSDAAALAAALAEARAGRAEGGIPIGAALVVDGEVLAVGRNRRVQDASPILHGETDCLANAGRLPARVYAGATMVTTLSPCDMCTGAILLYGIPRVVIGENRTFRGGEDLLRARGVEVLVLDDADCVEIMRAFIAAEPALWNEDIGADG